jgi:hypothetical protein
MMTVSTLEPVTSPECVGDSRDSIASLALTEVDEQEVIRISISKRTGQRDRHDTFDSVGSVRCAGMISAILEPFSRCGENYACGQTREFGYRFIDVRQCDRGRERVIRPSWLIIPRR